MIKFYFLVDCCKKYNLSNIGKNNTFFAVLLIKLKIVNKSKSGLNRLKGTLKWILLKIVMVIKLHNPKVD